MVVSKGMRGEFYKITIYKATKKLNSSKSKGHYHVYN